MRFGISGRGSANNRRSAPMADSALAAPNSLLEVDDIGISFGGLKAVQNFSIRIPRGALYGLIGPNGAGKTTVFNLLTGVYQTMGGRMSLDASNLVGLKPHEVAAAGIARPVYKILVFSVLKGRG